MIYVVEVRTTTKGACIMHPDVVLQMNRSRQVVAAAFHAKRAKR